MGKKWDKYIKQRLKTQRIYLNLFLQYFTKSLNLNNAYNFIPNHIYHSTSFSCHENYNKIYEKERNSTTKFIREIGWHVYAPYEKTDPGKSVTKETRKTIIKDRLSPQKILDLDFYNIVRSELLLLNYNLASNGIGQEIQFGFFIPKIIYSRKRPTRLTGGLPGCLCLYYENYKNLKRILFNIFKRDSYKTSPFYIKDDVVYKGNTNLNKKFRDNLWLWK